MGHTSHASQQDTIYSQLAESAARQAEINLQAASLRRAALDEHTPRPPVALSAIRLAPAPVAPRPVPTQTNDDYVEARLAEITERERTLATRETLIEVMQADLDQSRQRLEQLLEQYDEQKAKSHLAVAPLVYAQTG